MQIETLASARHAQLGEDFDLIAFHDEFLGAGLIPVSLIHWEMTGDEAVGEMLWAWEPPPQ